MDKRNLAFIPLAGLIGGISMQSILPQFITLFSLSSCMLLGATAWIFWSRSQTSNYLTNTLTLSLMTCAGYLVASYHTATWLAQQQALLHRPFNITGIVRDVQQLSARPHMAAVHVSITTFEQPGNNHAYQGGLLVHYLPHKHAPAVGSMATITGIAPPRALPRPEITTYLRKQHIIHQLFSQRDAASICYQQGPASGLFGRCEQWLTCMRAGLFQRLTVMLSPVGKQYTGLMFCGHREAEADDVRNLFNRWGLGHFLARSGLHIVIFVFLIALLLRGIPLHAGWKELLLLCVCVVYDACTWSSISFLRAWLIVMLALARNSLDRHTPYQHLLSMSCIGMLCYNPCYLISLDFQLTYALTITLVLLSKRNKPNAQSVA